MVDEIEQLIRARKTEQARALIRKYLVMEKKSLNAKIQVCDWLKRLGLNREAYRLIAPKQWSFTRAENDIPYRTALLWAARLLNLQGASRYALQVIENLQSSKKNSKKEADAMLYKIAGNIFVSNFKYAFALRSFEMYFQVEKEPNYYEAKILKVSLADSLEQLGKTKEALQVLSEIPVSAQEKSLKGIIHQARGEYLARAKKLKEAKKELDQANALIPESDESTDRAFLIKWQAYVNYQLATDEKGKTAAKKLFSEALRRLMRPDFRPETWLDCYYRMLQLNLLSEKESILLKSYPGLSEEFLSLDGMNITAPIWIGEKTSDLVLRPSRREWAWKGQPQWGYSKEMEAIELLRRGGEQGVPFERLKTLLWPLEFASFLQLDSRIFQLFRSVEKHFGFKIKVENNVIYFSNDAYARIAIEFYGEFHPPVAPTYFENNPRFKLEQLSAYYQLGRTASFEFLAEQIKSGNILKVGKGKWISYSVNGISNRSR